MSGLNLGFSRPLNAGLAPKPTGLRATLGQSAMMIVYQTVFYHVNTLI